MGNGCESHLFSNIQELLSQNSLALYNYKVTAENDCSHEIKRHLLLRRKAMINLDSVLKMRHHFTDKGLYSQSYGFSSSHVQM